MSVFAVARLNEEAARAHGQGNVGLDRDAEVGRAVEALSAPLVGLHFVREGWREVTGMVTKALCVQMRTSRACFADVHVLKLCYRRVLVHDDPLQLRVKRGTFACRDARYEPLLWIAAAGVNPRTPQRGWGVLGLLSG